MFNVSSRAAARLIAAPLILSVLVTGQAAGAANATPAPRSTTTQATITVADEQQILRDRVLAEQALARKQAHARAARADRHARVEAREAAAIGSRIVAAAAAQAGKPYVYGATGASAFDCSGLTGWAYRAVGIELPRTSAAQAGVMTRVSQPMPGDLVYMPGHIGIYAGNGQMWHAPRSGDVVKLATIWTSNVTYGRVR